MTLLEFAKKHNLTKNKVKYYTNKHLKEGETYKKDGILHLTAEGEQHLLEVVEEIGCKSVEKPQTTDEKLLIENEFLKKENEILNKKIEELQQDKAYLQEQLQNANNRANFLTIQALPFWKRRKAMQQLKLQAPEQ